MRSKLYWILSKFNVFFKRNYSDRLRVLAYHKVPDEKAFEEQVIYLKSNYNIINVPQLKRYIDGEIGLPKNPLLITFDDGDISVLEKGLPVLHRHDIKSCLFIITGLVNTSNDVWISRVEQEEMKNGKTYQEARKLVNHFKNISNKERVGNMRDYPEINKQQLNTRDLIRMQEHGMYIANHTHTHPMLDKCSSEEILEELEASKEVFNELGLPGYNIFAYPNGNADRSTNAILRDANISMIFLFDHKINSPTLDPLNISRIRVDSDNELAEFKAKVSGVHPFIFNLKNKN